ncbi:MAG TPA: ABC transporter permease [Acidobacteriaceae bacterium]|jgi:predicted permease|nr:ABC transporter permease [Acidobacteriaceae bacterium]
MQGWFRDARYAVRQLRKTPAFTLTAIVTLALGIGANSTIFSWMSSTLFTPIPGAHPANTAVYIQRGADPSQLSYPDLVDLRAHMRTLSALIGWDTTTVDLTSAGKPQQLWAALTTANYFSALGVRPVIGRFFEPQEEQRPGGSPVAVLSYRTWQLVFDGDPHVLGRTIYLNQHPFNVIGVAPPLFAGASTGLQMDLWAPLMEHQQLEGSYDSIHDRNDQWLDTIGVLAPGATVSQARQELTLQMQQIARAFPDSHKGSNLMRTIPLWREPQSANQYLAQMLPPLLAIALVVLLLACVNVANLFLVRAVARRREMAVRLALGANRARLVRQLLIESVLVALAGGLLALFVTFWSASTFDRFLPPTDLPIQFHMHVDARVLAVTFALATLTGIAFGLLPALRSSRITPVTVLKEESGTSSGGRHKARLITGLVVAQISLSFLLLVCGGLFIRSFRKAQQADPGFRGDHVLLSSIDLYPAGYTDQTGVAFQRELLRRIGSIPGVRAVSTSSWSPLGFRISMDDVQPEGYVAQKAESMETLKDVIAPGYFHTLAIPLVTGRDFQPNDTADTQQVAIVNQAFAQKYWPGQNALGRRVKVDGSWRTVVGVAKTTKYEQLDETPKPFIYQPAFQDYRAKFVLDVLVKGDPNAYAARITDAVHSLNPDLPVLHQYPLARNVEVASTGTRVAGTFVGLFGLVGLALAAIGIYGVIAYTTRQRLHEIGIRMALGAKRRDIFDLVLKQGVRMAALGMAVGLIGSLLLTPLLRSQLYGVAPSDLLTYFTVAVLLGLVALAACFLPAQRAAQVEPIRVLRYE